MTYGVAGSVASENDEAYWRRRLRKVFGEYVETSRDLRFHGRVDVVLTMSTATASKNMQEDASAFETWSLATRIAGAKSVTLNITGEAQGGAHFQRFRYRIARFSRLFEAWFHATPELTSPLQSAKEGRGSPFFLNVESCVRTDKRKLRADHGELDLSARESDIEMALAHVPQYSQMLMRDFCLSTLGRQLPVGVFEGEVSTGTKVFSGGRSAIDLWGANARLALFELKNAQNKSLGALAELLFYATVMRDLQLGVLAFNPKKAARPSCRAISATRGVDAYLLAPAIAHHPLIAGAGAAVIHMINDAFAARGELVTVGLVDLQSEPRFVRVA